MAMEMASLLRLAVEGTCSGMLTTTFRQRIIKTGISSG